MTERTENIIGALVMAILVLAALGAAGWAIPNYYVYFKATIRDGLAAPCTIEKELTK